MYRIAFVSSSAANTNLVVQVDLIPIIRHTTSHKALTACPGPCQNEDTEVLDALRPESVRLGVGGDVLLEDEVLRGVEGVDGPVFGLNCEVSQHVFVSMMVCGIEDVVDALPPRFMFGSPKLAKLIHILVICFATLRYISRLGPPSGFGLPFCG
jgi:hypothetical protein